MDYLVLVACVYIRGGVCKSGVWIRRVSAIQGSGLEGCLQFRGLD